MGCCGCSVPDFEDKQPLIVDVHKLLSDKAWANFVDSLGYFPRKFLRRKNFVIEVPDNYFDFEQIEQRITSSGRGIKTTSSDENTNGGNHPNKLDGRVPSGRASNPEDISLDTTFSNDTAQKQTYEFKFSKTRTTTVEVSFQKGFTLGGKASFSIGAPKVLGDGEFGLEAEMQYNVTRSDGQSFEESMNMEATSSISVGPKSNYIANIQMDERSIHTSFQVITRMSMPQKKAPVYIRRKKDKSLVYVFSVKNLPDIFERHKMCSKVEGVDGIAAPDKIDFTIEGYIKGSLSLDHRINLTSDETEAEKTLAKNRQHQIGDDD